MIVGLGGSGGATLEWLMDDLREQLRAAGWSHDRLPECWQFVHVDVRTTPEDVAGRPGNVRRQGGSYIGVAGAEDSYLQLDASVAAQLAAAPQGLGLGGLARWRPDPVSASAIPITQGAGQFRAVGRIATLAKGQHIFTQLSDAVERFSSNKAAADLAELDHLINPAAGNSIVIIVSSIVGGSGASMTLDIANLLRKLHSPDFRSGESIAFLYTPEIFASTRGVGGGNANALGAISELLNARMSDAKAWTQEEWSVYRTGTAAPVTPGRGPDSVYPIGGRSGNGTPVAPDVDGIYRSFARVLTPLFLDATLQAQQDNWVGGNFLQRSWSTADNTGLTTPTGAGSRSVGHFGTLGYATVSLGNDRFAEYSAQRLSRGLVRTALRGYDDGDPLTTSETKLATAVTRIHPRFLDWVGVPRTDHPNRQAALVDSLWDEAGRGRFLEPYRAGLNYAGQQAPAVGLLSFFRDRLRGMDSSFAVDIVAPLDEASARWTSRIQQRLEWATARVIAEIGVEGAAESLNRLRGDLSAAAGHFGRTDAASLETATAAAQGELRAVQPNAVLQAHAGLGARVHDLVWDGVRGVAFSHVRHRAGVLLADLVTGVIDPLVAALNDAHLQLRDASALPIDNAPVGFRTALVGAWPTENGHVPSHLQPPTNEILIRPVDGFSDTFDALLGRMFPQTAPMQARSAAEGQVLLRRVWSGPADQEGTPLALIPGDDHDPVTMAPTIFAKTASWWPTALDRQSAPQKASYRVRVQPEQILDLARQWIARPSSVFNEHVTENVSNYLMPAGSANATMIAQRQNSFVTAFAAALDLATPFVGLDRGTVRAVHGSTATGGASTTDVYYSMSALGIAPGDAVAVALQQLPAVQNSAATRTALNGALTPSLSSRVDIIGRYEVPYLPMAIGSLAGPIRDAWTTAAISANPTATADFWTWRRGRPLAEFVPAPPDWQQAFYTGWLVGLLTGSITETPDARGRSSYRVWDVGRRLAVPFPSQLLGERRLGNANEYGSAAENESGLNVPAELLESLSLVLMQCENGDLAPLAPYSLVTELGSSLLTLGHLQNAPSALRPAIEQGVDPTGASIPFLAGGTSARERATIARDWAQSLHDYIRDTYLPFGVMGSTGAGAFAQITVHNFADVPREYEAARELATAALQLRDEMNSVYLSAPGPGGPVMPTMPGARPALS